MGYEIYAQFNEFVEMLETGQLDTHCSNNFLDTSDFEDDYGHNEIGYGMMEFEKLVKKYLHENHSGEYGMHSDYCVHIYTVDFLKEKELDERYIVY